jgi:inositol 1,4,5-triphosphate receptor type 3
MNFTAKSKFFNQTGEEDDDDCFSSEDSMSFFNFMIATLHKFLIVTNKSRNQNHVGFIFDIFYSIIELLIEIIQGNKKELLSKNRVDNSKNKSNNLTLFTFKTFVSLDSEVLFNDTLISGPGFKIRLLLISFFIALLEEKTNKELQKIIMKFLTLNKVLDSINFTMKNYFNEQTKDDPKFKDYYSDYSEKQIIQREFVFDHIIYSFFKHHYFHSEVSKVSKEFKLANNYYKYIKKISINEKSPEAKDLIKKIEKMSESEAKKQFALFNKKIIKNNEIAPINLTNEKEKSISISFIEHYYIIKFFESITKVVEIRLPQEHRNVSVIFTVPCEMIHLTEMTKEEFVHNVDRTNENSKKCELVRNLPLFQLEIEYFKNIKVNFIQKIILSIDFIYIQILMYLYATIFLIIMLFTLEGYKKIEPIVESEDRRRLNQIPIISNSRKLLELPSYITDAIDESISKYGLYYDFVNYGFVVLNGLFIFSWVSVKMPLYYIFDKFQYMEENKIQKEEDLTLINKIYISILNTMIGRDYINSLLYMFIISLIGAIMKRGEIIYAFFLLAILDLNQTLKGIAISIKAKGPDLVSSFIFLAFIVYFYTNIGFFFLNSHFEADIENDIPDNYCLCLSFCFLTNFDAGIRARGGAADQMIRISFERNTALYVYRLFYDLSYFLICIIIMIDLIFGIILGTFSEKREEERKHDNDKINHCFICHITREIIEKKREDFQIHREQKHYLWNYVEYMIFLNFSKMHELNAFNSFAKTNLDKKNICFLPSAQDDFEKDEITQEIILEKEDEEPEENSEESSENTERVEDNLIDEN